MFNDDDNVVVFSLLLTNFKIIFLDESNIKFRVMNKYNKKRLNNINQQPKKFCLFRTHTTELICFGKFLPLSETQEGPIQETDSYLKFQNFKVQTEYNHLVGNLNFSNPV